MKIYYADIRGVDERDALYPPLSESPGSALGVSLLAVAYEDYKNSHTPLIKRLLKTSGSPNYHFSISHSRTHVLCALSGTPVGADTLDHRHVRQHSINKLVTQTELEDFSFHEIWALRESFFKLTGTGNLRTMRFSRDNGKIKGPRPDVYSRLYDDIEGSSTAVSAYNDRFPDSLIEIPVKKLLKK